MPLVVSLRVDDGCACDAGEAMGLSIDGICRVWGCEICCVIPVAIADDVTDRFLWEVAG